MPRPAPPPPSSTPPRSQGAGRPRLLVVEPAAGGHRGENLRWLVEAWRSWNRPGSLVVAAPPALFEAEPSLAEMGPSVETAPLLPSELWDRGGAVHNALGAGRWRPVQRLVAAHAPDRVLSMSFEHFVAALATRRPLGVPFSGLAFRPPSGAERGARDRLRAVAFRRALGHPRLETLFSFDPLAVPHLQWAAPALPVRPVPDPTPPEPVLYDRAAVRAEIGVEDGRRLAVLLGGLDPRKGALTTLRALLDLPPDAARSLCVVLWGRVEPAVAEAFAALRAEVDAQVEGRGGVQLVVRDAFVPRDRLQSVVAAADVVLLPYDRHVGSSGFLMRAAGAGTPVLSQAFGLMGHLVRTHGLGRTADTSSPEALARALADAARAPLDGFDADAARAFAGAHTPDAFARALLRPLGL